MMLSNENAVFDRSKRFAIRIVRLYRHLADSQSEYIMSKQVLRSGTSIGANIAEALKAFSTPDFIYKFQIALKEAAETAYWLELLYETDYIDEASYQSIQADCDEITALLTSILKSLKAKQSVANHS